MDLDFAEIPIGEKVVGHYERVTNVMTRTSETEVLQEQFRKSDGVLLVSMVLDIQTGEPKLRYYHQNFWKVILDGQPFNPSIQTTPKLKTINAHHESGVLTLLSA